MLDNYKFRDLDRISPHSHPFDAINGTLGHPGPAVVVLGDYLTGTGLMNISLAGIQFALGDLDADTTLSAK